MSIKRSTRTSSLLASKPQEVADQLGVSKRTVFRWIASGELDSFKMPGGRNAAVLIPDESVAAFLQRQRRIERVS